MFARQFTHRRQILHVIGQDDAGHAAPLQRNAQRAVDQVPRLLGAGGLLHEVVRDILEQRNQVDFLLEVAAQRAARLLAHQRQHGLVVQLGVVQAVEQMDRARPRGRHADADLAGELRMRAGHEGGHLLVAGLHELQRLAPSGR